MTTQQPIAIVSLGYSVRDTNPAPLPVYSGTNAVSGDAWVRIDFGDIPLYCYTAEQVEVVLQAAMLAQVKFSDEQDKQAASQTNAAFATPARVTTPVASLTDPHFASAEDVA